MYNPWVVSYGNLVQESLRFRLQGTVGDIGSWGHEYVRYTMLLPKAFFSCMVIATFRLGCVEAVPLVFMECGCLTIAFILV